MSLNILQHSIGKVSVIIPFYNQSEFVEECVGSIIAQSYSNWEIIIVDDGSIEPLPITPTEKIKIVRQENQGLPSARNTGIANATGEYIQFLDADDTIHFLKFETQIREMQEKNADIAISGYWAYKHPDTSNGVTSDTELKGDPLKEFILRWEKGLCIPIHCFLFKRHVIDIVGNFDTSLPDHEDWDYHIRTAYRNFVYCHNKAAFALYRVHNKSLCRSKDVTKGKEAVANKHQYWDLNRGKSGKFYLMNTTFIYCVRIDSPERLTNLDFAMAFMRRHFKTNIVLAEADVESKISGRYGGVQHVFVEDSNPVFHRTKLINEMVKQCTTPYVCNIDVDVFTDPIEYEKAVTLLTENTLVYPYNGRFYDIPQYYAHNRLLEAKDINPKERGLVNPNSYGGMVFFRKEEFIEGGMENENFVSWGAEDNERYLRFRKLDYPIARMNNPLYHFSHPRGVNSCEENPNYQKGIEEYENISAMSSGELRDYVETFTWTKTKI